MPKEKVKLEDGEDVRVGWSKANEYVEIGVGVPEQLIVVSEYNDEKHAEVVDSLFVMFNNEKDLTKLIRVLMRARKQAFGKA